MEKARRRKKVKVRARPLTKLVILVLLVAIGWQLYGLRSQVRRAQEEREQYAALVAEKQRENAALEADITEGPTDEKLEEIARDELGKRRLAYPINDLMEGYYVLMTFNAAAAIPAELDRIFRITDGVMRSLIVCKDQ